MLAPTIALLVAVLGGESSGGGGAPPRDAFLESWRWASFGAEAGFGGHPVIDVRDCGDELWVATRERPFVYDGWTWREVPRHGGPWEGYITTLAPDPDRAGGAWITAHGRAFRGTSSGMSEVSLALPPGRMLAGLARTAGDVDVATMFRPDELQWEVARVVDDTAHVIPLPAAGGRGFEAASFATESGRLFVARGDGLYVYAPGDGPDDPGSWVRHLGEGEGFVARCVLESRDGRGLCGVAQPADLAGLWTWSPDEPPQRVESEGHGIVMSAALWPNGDALVAYESGTVRLLRGGVWRSIEPLPEGLQSVRRFALRPNGDLWSATGRGLYLLRTSPPLWSSWKSNELHALEDRVADLSVGPDGHIYAATAGGVIAYDEHCTRVPLPAVPPEASVTRSVAHDRAGRLHVVTTEPGILRLDGPRWTAITHDARGAPLPAFGRIVATPSESAGASGSDDVLWLLARATPDASGTQQPAPVYRLVGDGPPEAWSERGQLDATEVFDVAIKSDGSLWCATDNGLWHSSADGWVVHGTRDGTFSMDLITALEPDRAGGLWVATGSRVLHLDATCSVDGSSFPTTAVSPIVDLQRDAHDRLWVCNRSSVFCLVDGEWLPIGVDATSGNALLLSLIATERRLVVASQGAGLRVLALDHADGVPPRVHVTSATVSGEDVHAAWRVRSHWSAEGEAHITTQWRVDGGPWSTWSFERGLSLTGLAVGDHLIEVRARSPLGLVGPTSSRVAEVTLPIVRDPRLLIPVGLLSLALVVLAGWGRARRRRDADALRRSESEHRSLMEDASDAILLFDPATARCVYANGHAPELFRSAVTGRETADLLGSEGARFIADVDHRQFLELRVERSDAEPIIVEISATRLADGRVQAILRDLTERRRLEHEQREFERKLTETQRLESLGLLAGGVAHDFNNLLMVMSGNADQALRSAPPGSPQEAELHRILGATQRASDLTQQLLVYAGRGALTREPLDLNALVLEMGSLLATSVNKNVRIRHELQAGLPLIDGDQGRIQQVVLNLIVNAAEAYDGEGEVVISTRLVEDPAALGPGVWVEPFHAGQHVCFEVRDQGAGMDEATVTRIFEPFFSTKFHGRGLGLAAVRGIVRSHDGALKVDTGPGRGTAFAVLFPTTLAAAPPPVAPPAASPYRTHHGNIVVVEDEEAVREITCEMLRALGYSVQTAATGHEALRYAATHGNSVSAYVIDLVMPGLDGLSTLDRLLELDADARVLIMSGYAEPGLETLTERGARGFLRKPFGTRELALALERLTASTAEA